MARQGRTVALAVCCEACCQVCFYSYLFRVFLPRRPVLGYPAPWRRPAIILARAESGSLPNMAMMRA